MEKEIIKRINELRYQGKRKKPLLTKEQVEFIKLCRDVEPNVSYTNMINLWKELGWGAISKSILEDYTKKVREGFYEIKEIKK